MDAALVFPTPQEAAGRKSSLLLWLAFTFLNMVALFSPYYKESWDSFFSDYTFTFYVGLGPAYFANGGGSAPILGGLSLVTATLFSAYKLLGLQSPRRVDHLRFALQVNNVAACSVGLLSALFVLILFLEKPSEGLFDETYTVHAGFYLGIVCVIWSVLLIELRAEKGYGPGENAGATMTTPNGLRAGSFNFPVTAQEIPEQDNKA